MLTTGGRGRLLAGFTFEGSQPGIVAHKLLMDKSKVRVEAVDTLSDFSAHSVNALAQSIQAAGADKLGGED